MGTTMVHIFLSKEGMNRGWSFLKTKSCVLFLSMENVLDCWVLSGFLIIACEILVLRSCFPQWLMIYIYIEREREIDDVHQPLMHHVGNDTTELLTNSTEGLKQNGQRNVL
ncbi:hypothetical protein PVAP13_3NG176552 [Panicum virgatum]|uniref:Uncharacterized protein n=1 Tax=Panicum virgatum TaxID=38727 RepID=A0A8T0TX55_PANVG|nr:hypothetical protein PVAP13_3NG176552 [Panicum virgatum]